MVSEFDRFPELAWSLADALAQVLLVCSSWAPGAHKTEQWLAQNKARAIEYSVYVSGVCQASPVSVGRSQLVDPMGYVETDLGPEPGVRAVDVSLGTVARVSAAPEDRGWLRNLPDLSVRGAIGATLMIGIFYSACVNQDNWSRIVLVTLGLSVVTFVLSLLWRERRTA